MQHKSLHVILLAGLSPLLAACSSMEYYRQSVSGHINIIIQRQAVNRLVNAPDTPADLREKLLFTQQLLRFAHEHLRLPNNGSYEDYANINREYALWNVFAAPPLSLKPNEWCFLIVGCLTYRGYFKKQDALGFAAQLKRQGFDVYLGGVRAYSTLGWFDDPLLNTMLSNSRTALARVIFHELVHQKVYIKHDTEFNEALADAVAEIGLDRLQDMYPQILDKKMRAEREYDAAISGLILSYRDRLQELYASDITHADKHQQKEVIFRQLRDAYIALRDNNQAGRRYDGWFLTEINNAKISAFSTYRRRTSDFLTIYARLDHDLDKFYALIQSWKGCQIDQRHNALVNHLTDGAC